MSNPRHRWTAAQKISPDSDTPYNLRTCVHCGMLKITKLPPQGWPWHEFEPVDGPRLVQERTPPCVRRAEAA